jgi:hypothetical protein
MGGGILQLVAVGVQDIYLIGNPQITFFKSAYKKYTNFTMESIVQTFDGNADFGQTCRVTIDRKGDLIKTLNNDFVPIDNIGFSKMFNFAIDNNERPENILYKCSKEKYPELIDDLIITGCHSILVDDFKKATNFIVY